MALAQPKTYYSPEEYLTLERAATFRSEYADGEIDVLVVCGKLVFHDQFKDVVLNPKVIIEVLSPSTEAYDRGEKFASYRQLESLTDYLLISQDKPLIEHYVRHGKFWMLSEESDLVNSIVLESIECSLPLKDVYARVQFPTKEPPA